MIPHAPTVFESSLSLNLRLHNNDPKLSIVIANLIRNLLSEEIPSQARNDLNLLNRTGIDANTHTHGRTQRDFTDVNTFR